MNLDLPKTLEQAEFIMQITGGVATADVCENLGIKRSTLYDRISAAKHIMNQFGVDGVAEVNNGVTLPHEAKILLWDIETSTIDLHIRQYDLTSRKGRHHYDTIHRDWNILGAAWKLLGDSSIRCVSVSSQNPTNDEYVVKKLHEVLSGVTILIAHNGDAFDLKKYNARALFYGLPPITHIHTIDTLKEARKSFKLTSNTLGYLGRFLGCNVQKDKSPDWNAILEGDSEELSKMRQYNKADVIVLEEVYLKMRPWMKTHPNLQAYSKIKDISGKHMKVCPACGSEDIKKNGIHITRAGKTRKQRFYCNGCHHDFMDHIYGGKKNG